MKPRRLVITDLDGKVIADLVSRGTPPRDWLRLQVAIMRHFRCNLYDIAFGDVATETANIAVRGKWVAKVTFR